MTSKEFGGKLIGMAEYSGFYDRNDEPLLHINTKTNKEQGWKGDEDWDIQIHYFNLYITEKQNITACIQCSSINFLRNMRSFNLANLHNATPILVSHHPHSAPSLNLVYIVSLVGVLSTHSI